MSESPSPPARLSPLRPLWRLKVERERRGLSQQQLADQLGVTVNSVSRWERGVSTPIPYFRHQLCDLFGLSSEALGFLLDPTETGANHAAHPAQATHLLMPAVWLVPLLRNPFFTGREEVLARLHERLYASKSRASVPQALCGLAGMGKTQTALEYCYRYCQEYQAVLWLRAEQRETLETDLVTAATLLGLPEHEEHDQRRIVKAFKRWLGEHDGWLLALDNPEDLDLLAEVMPPLHAGHLLLTMRAQATGTLAQRLELSKMEPEEGAFFLLRRAKRIEMDAPLEACPPAEREGALELAHLLDGLPLALDQAGAYIEETACSFADYLVRYQKQRAPLLQQRGRITSGHPASLATTLSLVIERVEAYDARAGDLLRLCAFLYPDGIPEQMLIEGTAESDSVLEPLVGDLVAFDTALKILRDFSLVQRHAESKTLSLHRLVQVVVQDRLEEPERRQWAELAVELVSRVFPDSGEDVNWLRCQRYLPQVLACAALIEHWQIVTHQAGLLLLHLGSHLQERSEYPQAEAQLSQAREILQRTVGERHADLAHCLNDLAVLYRYQGKYEQAERLYRQALSIRESLFEEGHPSLMETLNNLVF